MTIAQEVLAEFEEQAPVTRTFLERLPEEKLLWKPHTKSMTAGQLALHLALVPGNIAQATQGDQIPVPSFDFPHPKSTEEVLAAHDQGVATVRSLLPAMDDAKLHGLWRIVDGQREVVAMPKQAVLRNIMLNHWYQHRGQFGVYLRMLDVPVPSSWGPSGDEPPRGFQL